MINKNRFSIKNTKKVLHKVGKRWVVVSAVLLGLVAGGATVTTQANAAENDMVANHATPAETSVAANSAAAQPAHAARLGAEFGEAAPASNPLDNDVNNAKDKVTSQLESVKTKIQQDSSYADVTNLTKLANAVRGNTSATSAYQNLGSLASSADNFNNIALGEDSAAPASDTVFGMFSQASNDFNTMYNAQSTQKGQHYLGEITSLFNKASGYANSTIKSSGVSLSSQFPVQLSGHYLSYKHKNNISLQGSITPTLSFNSNVSINIPNIINNGVDIDGLINNIADTLKTENSTPTSDVLKQVESSNDYNIYTQMSNQGLLPSVNSSSNNDLAGEYLDLKTDHPNAANKIVNDTKDELNSYFTNGEKAGGVKALGLELIETSAKAINAVLNTKSPMASEARKDLNSASTQSQASTALSLITGYTDTYSGMKAVIDTEISNSASAPYSSAVNSTINSIADKARPFADSLFATVSGGNSFGPFANDKLSNITNYLNGLDNRLNSANASNLGLPDSITSIIQKFITDAHSYVDKAVKADNKVTDVLNKFFSNTSTTKGAYNNLINKVAALPNDLKPTSHVAAGSTEEAKLYSDYSSIANDANIIITAANRHNATESGSVKRYVSDATRDANKSIVSEASSSAASMSSTSASMSAALDHAYNASESAANNLSSNDKNLEDSLLNKNNASVSTLLTASANYSNSLSGQTTSMALDTDTITFKSNDNNVGNSVTLTGFSGASFSANSLDVPNNYSLNNPTSTISFNGSSANAIVNKNVSVNVTLNKFNETVNFINKDNGSNVGHESFTNVSRNYTESLASLSIPSSYKLASSANNELVFNSNSQVDPVYVEPKQETDTIDYRDGDTPEGSTKLTGSNGDTIPLTAYNKINSGFVLNGNPELTYDGGTHTVNVKPVPATSVTDHVVFNGAPSTDNYSKTSASNTHYNVSAPAGYHFTTGSASSASFMLGRSNGTVTFNVASNTVNEDITFAGDSDAATNHRSVSGSYNTSSSVSAPADYHFANGSTESSFAFGISNGSTTLNVVKDSTAATSVTDTVVFNGDNNSSESVSGSVNTSTNVSAPANYHFINGNSSEATINLGSSAHDITLNVASNSSNATPKKPNKPNKPVKPTHHQSKAKSVTDTIIFNGDNNYHESIKGNVNTSVSVSAPADYHFTSGNSSEATFNLGSSAHDIILNVASNSSNVTPKKPNNKPNNPVTPAHHPVAATSVTDTIIFNGDNNYRESVNGNANTSASVSAPANYHFTSGSASEATFNLGSSAHSIVLNVASNSSNVTPKKPNNKPNKPVTPVQPHHPAKATSITDTIIFNGDNNYRESVNGNANTSASVSAPANYHFTSGNSSEATFNLGSSAHNVVLSVASNGSKSNSTASSASNSTKPNVPGSTASNNSAKSNSASSSAESTGSNASKSIASNSSSVPASSSATNNFVPPFIFSSSAASSSASASVKPSSASAKSASVKFHSAEPKSQVANYVMVTRALQLHTNPNFTRKNGVIVVKPGTRLDLEKPVRVRRGLVRYEVKYNDKNYFVTANKKFTSHISYTLAKPTHYRYFKVGKALQLHTSPDFNKKNGVMVVKPGAEFRINRVVKAHGAIRYEVSYKGSVYFVTANKGFTANAYLQKSNFNKRGRKLVRVTRELSEYKKINFAKRSFIRSFHKGAVLPVKRVITIAHGEMTRLQLTNGHYVTSNKNLVKVIK